MPTARPNKHHTSLTHGRLGAVAALLFRPQRVSLVTCIVTAGAGTDTVRRHGRHASAPGRRPAGNGRRAAERWAAAANFPGSARDQRGTAALIISINSTHVSGGVLVQKSAYRCATSQAIHLFNDSKMVFDAKLFEGTIDHHKTIQIRAQLPP